MTRVSTLAMLFVSCLAASAPAADTPDRLTGPLRTFLDGHCVGCHDGETKKGGLDLDTMAFEPGNPRNFAGWVKVFERVCAGEMPPKKSVRPDPKEVDSFSRGLSSTLTTAERERVARDGRAGRRRLNRLEYENVLRDLLSAPWLEVKEMLPEDGVAHRFNKVGDALDVSHVQMARYLVAADYALRQAMAAQVDRPPSKTVRYYARDQSSFSGKFKYSVFNSAPERATFPTLGSKAQPDVRSGKDPVTVGPADPERREQEGVGLVCGAYEPIEPKFNAFRAPSTGRYRLRFNAHSVWVGPNGSSAVNGVANAGPKRWFIPNFDDVSAGRTPRAHHPLFRDAAAPTPAARLPSTSRPSRPSTSSTPGSSPARRSAPTPPACSDPGRARGGSRTRSPSRTASPASSTDGWKSKGRSSTSGRRPGIGSSSATSRSRNRRAPRDGSRSSRPTPRRTRRPCWPASPAAPIAGRSTTARRCGSCRSSPAG